MRARLGPKTLSTLRHCGKAISFGILVAAIGACATGREPSPPEVRADAVHTTEPEPPRWWYMRFRLTRSEDGDVDSFLDALIAAQILAAVIAEHGSDIALWRFHRRWPRDSTGHQFSFIFFAPTPVADRLVEQVGQDALLDRLKTDGHLVEFRVQPADPDNATDPAATSDASWPPVIQKEWPKFIMGASRMWLGLVQTEAARHRDLELYERYQAVELALDQLWFEEANHAFFHHLSALFGYKPVQVIRRDIMTF